jgi:hypothetical protein
MIKNLISFFLKKSLKITFCWSVSLKFLIRFRIFLIFFKNFKNFISLIGFLKFWSSFSSEENLLGGEEEKKEEKEEKNPSPPSPPRRRRRISSEEKEEKEEFPHIFRSVSAYFWSVFTFFKNFKNHILLIGLLKFLIRFRIFLICYRFFQKL